MEAITIGGKGSSLSSASVFSVANKLAQLRIDSSILDKLSSSSSSSTDNKSKNSSPSHKCQITLPEFLTLEESRAAYTLLLSKLLLISGSTNSIRVDIPNFICETLNSGLSTESSSLSPLSSIDVTEDEKGILETLLLASAIEGICALLDHGASSLSPVAETVVALSCEALNAKVSAFNLVDSGDGKCLKDEAGVAGDLKVLLNGSKLIGKQNVDTIPHIPQLYGSLREVSRNVHARARVALNSAISSDVVGTGKAWLGTLYALRAVLKELGEDSSSRVHQNAKSVGSDSLKTSLSSLVCECAPTKESLICVSKSALQADLDGNYVQFAHNVYELLFLVRTVVSWEMTTAAISLGGSDLLEGASKLESNGENTGTEKKSDKRKKVLGKGTTAILQLIKDGLRVNLPNAVDESAIIGNFAENLRPFWDPRVPSFLDYSERIKKIVESNDSRRLPKLPKGTRDFAKEQMTVREKAFSIITEVFKRHGAMTLDTPVFELRETLVGKYGEDSKLIYDLADQGGELCSLRYDLTVPFARYLAMNGLTSFKRYQIAKVYRRDNPSKGRFREFYQCDFDIAGQFDKMGPDFEVIKILSELLDELNIGDYEVKLNHRKLLDGMLDICGVPPEKFRTICSSIDKLDKQSFEQVKKEMVDEKGLSIETADRIGSFVKERGSPLELLSKLKQEGSEFLKHEESLLALDELDKLFKALEKSECIDKIVFDLSLARGLDYYTGVVFEAVFKGTTQVGSIAAGGRYDKLIGMFGSKEVPAVGVSLGIERVFAIMEQNQKDQKQVIRANETEVLVGVIGDDLSLVAKLISELWRAKIKSEYTMVKKVVKIFERAEALGIPFAVMVGERELKEGIVKVRDVKTKLEEAVPRDRIVEELQKRLKNSS